MRTDHEKEFASRDAPETTSDAWLSVAHAEARRAKNPQSSSEKRPLATHPRVIPRATFRPPERLKLTARFRAIRRAGHWVKGAGLAVGTLPNALLHPRLGIRIQRGLRGAVARNRAKRLVRELYRQNKQAFGSGRDIIVVLKRIHGLDQAHLKEELLSLCKKLPAP